MSVSLITRTSKGSTLTVAELDGDLTSVQAGIDTVMAGIEQQMLLDPSASLAQAIAAVARGLEHRFAASAGQTYLRNGLVASTSLKSVATFTRNTVATMTDASGLITSVASGVPRVSTAGYLPEGASANLYLWSTDPTNAVWTFNGNTLDQMVAAAGTSPDGTNNAVKLLPGNNGSTQHQFFQPNGATAGSKYTYSLYIKAAGYSIIEIDALNDGSLKAQYNVSNGTIVSTTGSVTATIVPAGAGWFRVSLTWVATVTGGARDTIVYLLGNGTVRAWLADGTSGYLIYGPQIEICPFASSYMPTTTATVSRSADACTSTVNIPIGQDFTVAAKFIGPPQGATQNGAILLSFGTNNNGMTVGLNGGPAVTLGGKTNGLTTSNGLFFSSISYSPGQPVGVVFSVTGDTLTWSVNGAAAISTTMPGGALAEAVTTLFIGAGNGGGSGAPGCPIRELDIHMRAFSGAECQSASDVGSSTTGGIAERDYDFTTQTYRFIGQQLAAVTDTPMTAFSRSTTSMGITAAGYVVPIASGTPNITDAGLTVDPAGTNLALHSSDFDVAGTWVPTRNGTGAFPTVTANFDVAPDGTTTADRIQFDRGAGGTATDYSLLAQTVTGASAVYTDSIWLKSNTGANQNVLIYTTTGGVGRVVVVTPTWQRFALTGAAGANPNLLFGTRGGTGSYFTGGDQPLDILAWGGQIEASPYVTSYMPTTTGSASRSADALTQYEMNPPAFTILAKFVVPTLSGNRTAWQWDDGTSNNRAAIYMTSTGNLRLNVTVASASFEIAVGAAVTPGTVHTLAAAFANGDIAASLDGAAVVTMTTVPTLPTMSSLHIGEANSSSNHWGPGYQKFKRWRARRTNAQLQADST